MVSIIFMIVGTVSVMSAPAIVQTYGSSRIARGDVDQARQVALEDALVKAVEETGIYVKGYSSLDDKGSLNEFSWLKREGIIRSYEIVKEDITEDTVSLEVLSIIAQESEKTKKGQCSTVFFKRNMIVMVDNFYLESPLDYHLSTSIKNIVYTLPEIMKDAVSSESINIVIVEKQSERNGGWYNSLVTGASKYASHKDDKDMKMYLDIAVISAPDSTLKSSGNKIHVRVRATINDFLSYEVTKLPVWEFSTSIMKERGKTNSLHYNEMLKRIIQENILIFHDMFDNVKCKFNSIVVNSIDDNGVLHIHAGRNLGIQRGQLFIAKGSDAHYMVDSVKETFSSLKPVMRTYDDLKAGDLISLTGI